MRDAQSNLKLRLLPMLSTVGIALVLISLAASAVTRQLIVMPQLRELEAQADRKDLRRVLLAIDSKKLQLATLAYQGAIDDRMHEFALHPDAQVWDASSPAEMLSNFHVDFMVVFDRDNRLIAQRIAGEADSLFAGGELPAASLQPLLIDLAKVNERAPLFNAGIAATARGAIIYAVASIMRADTTGAAAGNLLLATAFDNEMRREIENNAQLAVAFSTPMQRDFAATPKTPDTVYRADDDTLDWLLRDDRGAPLLKLTLSLPRRDYDTKLLVLPGTVSFLTTMLGFGIILIVFRRELIDPMLAISRHLRSVRQTGNYSLRLDSSVHNEIGELSRDIDALVQHARTQQMQLQAQTAEMQRLSFQDGLTGLANRRRFDQALADNWAIAQRSHTPLALIMFDVDYFKDYNDNYGHQRGDEALRKLADIVRRVVARQSDLAARYGGEEFAILLPDTTESGAENIAIRLQAEVARAALPHARSRIGAHLSISAGIAALMPDHRNSQRDLVHRADAALYASKARGRNCITLASRRDDL